MLRDLKQRGLAAPVVAVCDGALRTGIVFVDGVQQEGKANRTKAKAA